jgi:hypothetical protein
LRAPGVGDGVRRHACARARVGEAGDLVRGRRLRLERAEGRVALDVPLDVTRLDDVTGRERRAADHALDVLGDRLLVADAVLDGGDGAVREGVRGRGDRRGGVHRLRRDDAEVARGQRGRVARCTQAADELAGAGDPQAALVDGVDVLGGEVVRPDLDVVELCQARGEERADRAATDDADPHRRVPSRQGRGLTPDMSRTGIGAVTNR